MRKIKLFISLMLFSLIMSCSSGYVMKDPVDVSQYTPDTENSNLLVKMQSRLVLPDGWQFKKTNKKAQDSGEIRQSTFFEFNDRQNNVYGSFNYTVVGTASSIDPEKLIKIIAEIRDDVSNKSIMKTYINRKESYILTGSDKKKNWDYMAAIIPEGNAYNEIVLLSDPGYLKANPSVAYRIFNSYSYTRKELDERIVRGGIKFKSDDDAWFWFDDWTGKDFEGYLIMDSSTHETPIEFMGVATLESANMDSIKTFVSGLNEKVIMPEFDVNFKFVNQQVSGKALVTKSNKNIISIYYVVKIRNKSHLLMVCYQDGVVDIKPEKIHTDWKLLLDVINKYFYI